MVWPFSKREDNSPDSFERALSKIAEQIKSTSGKLATLRQRARRYNGLIIFYGILGYLLYLVVLLSFFGYQNITPPQGGGLFGAPLGIYIIKKMVNEYYARRIRSAEERLVGFQKEQAATIDRLKAATKYSTTQSLIEKYGGTMANDTHELDRPKKQPHQRYPTQQRVHSGRPQQPPPQAQRQLEQQQIQQKIIQQQLAAQMKQGFSPVPGGRISPAPNQPPQPQPLHMQGHVHSPSIHHLQPEEASAPKWYDRIMDMILGEDETSAKNRYALICKKCRMVNGLAPPGTLNADEVEEWGCARCGTMNGKRKEEPLSNHLGLRMDGEESRGPTPGIPENSASGSEGPSEVQSDGSDFKEEGSGAAVPGKKAKDKSRKV